MKPRIELVACFSLAVGCGGVDASHTDAAAHASATAVPSASALPSAPIEPMASAAPSASSAPSAVVATPKRAPLSRQTVKTALGSNVLVVPGAELPEGPAPIITALHGLCETGPGICDILAPITDGKGLLACPTGNGECDKPAEGKGKSDWILGRASKTVRASLDVSEKLLDEGDDPARGDVLLGNSRGAYAACQIVYDIPNGPWTGLVLISASVDPDPKKLVRGGIKRVLFADLEFDVAAQAMQKAQKKLCAAGLPARYVSLGVKGHGIHPDGAVVLAPHLDWVMGKTPNTDCVPASSP